MGEAAVQLKVAGKTYQVITSAAEDQLKRLAQKVEDALAEVLPDGRQPSPQALVLAAITLAHELEEERRRRIEAEERHRRTLEKLLGRVDDVLAEAQSVPARRTQDGRNESRGGSDRGGSPPDLGR